MFSTTGLFKGIPCPGRDTCQAVNCIFSHDRHIWTKADGRAVADHGSDQPRSEAGQAVKRRKIDAAPEHSRAQRLEAVANDRSGAVVVNVSSAPGDSGKTRPTASPQSLEKAITPPPTGVKQQKARNNGADGAAQQISKKEILNPRMLPRPPAGHEKRTLYLKHMHEQMTRLNGAVQASDNASRTALLLTEQELIKASLDEEERLASDNPGVYANVIKQRIGTYRKMPVDGWVEHVKISILATKKATEPIAQKEPLMTGLTSSQEVKVLEKLVTGPQVLTKLGYVLEAPGEHAVAEARQAIEKRSNHENCDRCGTRFQVFPDRRQEDGVLTTNGPCCYHWGKLRRQKRERTDAQKGEKDQIYTCCGGLMKSAGCSNADSHVYKINDVAQMALVLPFIQTPENGNLKRCDDGQPCKAITFDCEMGYTALGLELIRLTAVSWPDGGEVIDVLVQPKGAILDFNTRFSGVLQEDFTRAVTWVEGLPPRASVTSAKGSRPALPLVADPESARRILCSYIQPSTPLMGHALENDLNAMRLCHPTIVDTVALFPHPAGLPIRYGLRQLASTQLGREIQTGGEAGHDSLEDARATGDLVRFKVAEKWRELKKQGWRFQGTKLLAPTAHSQA